MQSRPDSLQPFQLYRSSAKPFPQNALEPTRTGCPMEGLPLHHSTMSTRIIGGIDIGTDKVAVLIGEVDGGTGLNIIGRGEASSNGVRKGDVVDFRTVSDCTHVAITTAERNAGAQIERAYLSLSGRHLQGFFSRGSVPVADANGLVDERDLERAAESARGKALPAGRIYIHHIRCGYRLDGRSVEQPAGLRGEELEVGYWHVHADEHRVRELLRVVNHFGVEVDDLIVSSLASAAMAASEAERRTGAVVIDIGRGTTDYVLYREGCAVRTGSIAVGGDHLTNDLALGLRIERRFAEQAKLVHGNCAPGQAAGGERFWAYGDPQAGNTAIGNRSVPRRAVCQILQARCAELFSVVRKELGGTYQPELAPAGVILTGGSSRLPGMVECAAHAFGVDARLGEAPRWLDESLGRPEYATAVGLLYYGLTAQKDEDLDEAGQEGFVRRITRILTFTR